MIAITPHARLGVILSSGNWTLETYFRAYAPEEIGVHVTRIRLGSGGERRAADIETDILDCAALLADAGVDLICLQGTAVMMERGPDGEQEIVAAIEQAADTPAFTATGAAVAALRAAAIERPVLIAPNGEAATERERAFLEASGFSVIDATGLDLGKKSNMATPEDWLAAAKSIDSSDADGVFFSGSNTRATEAIASTETALGKPAVTSVQASLWMALRRLSNSLPEFDPDPTLGRLFLGR